MDTQSKSEAAIPNPALKLLSGLIGRWEMVATHPAAPDTTFHGRAEFTWIEGGAFLKMTSEFDEPGVPTSIAIFGSDDTKKDYFMLYFDEREVSRKYEVSLRDNEWKLWRDAPEFSQRFTGTFANDGQTIVGVWEMLEDGVTWKRDLEVTYTRAK